jgi:hypothetical protein
MNRSTRIRILLLLTLPALVAAAASVIGMLLIPDLPETLATHWGVDGTVNRVDGLGAYIEIVAGLVPIFVAALVAFTYGALRARTSQLFVGTVVALSIWFGVFISVSMFLAVWSQRGVTDVEALPGSTVVAPLLIGLGAAVVAAALGVLVTPRIPFVATPHLDAPGLDLAAGEQAYWSSTARPSKAFLAVPIGAILLIVVVFTVVGLPIWLTAIVALALASLFTMVAWNVVVDRHGLTVTGLLGFPRIHIPLAQVDSATAITLNAFREFGGWGVRVGRTGDWGVVVRSGDTIRVERTKGAPFVVTVDDAETGARLLTSLARRVSKKK